MFDFNDVWQPPDRLDLDEVRSRLAATAAAWLPLLFPQAKMAADRRTMRCADFSGRPPRKEGSCVIHLRGDRAGSAFDHGTGENAGPIDLVAHATGLVGRELFEEAARLSGLEDRTPAPAAPRRDHSGEIARILGGCRPVPGTPAEVYLRRRGLDVPDMEDLRFHPDLTDFESKRGWPGLVATVRDGRGEPTGGIHRTFLLEDGSGKAPPEKKMLGPVAGGSVRLAPVGEDGRLGIAEGIETALSAARIFGLPVWAALSADGLRRWQWPAALRRATIFADAGEAGLNAAQDLLQQLALAGIPAEVVRPLHGDDFNDDLAKSVTAGDYTRSGEHPQVARPRTLEEFAAAAQPLAPGNLQLLISIVGALASAGLDTLSERQVLALLKERTRIPVGELRKQLDQAKRHQMGGSGQGQARPVWVRQLRVDLSGAPERNEANVFVALTSDPAFVGTLAFDEFRSKLMIRRDLPWEGETPAPREWSETDDTRCAQWLQQREVNVSPLMVSRVVAALARDHGYHPVRDYLSSLAWDGTPRLETWAVNYLGAADTPLHRKFGALWMISAVARIRDPGCKVDHMLILEGPQDARKSSALKVLGGEWFTDELGDLGSKDAAQQMQGVWIIEIAELDAIGRADVSRIKAFLTRRIDRYRPPYGRYVVEAPRQCVFAGSVNPDTYLRDETGNRRFWPVRCGTIAIDRLARDRDQLWAEAVHRHGEGAIWWLDDAAMIGMAREAQAERFQSDAWDDLITRWLSFESRRVNKGFGSYDDWQTETSPRPAPLRDVSIAEILKDAIGLDPTRWTRGDQMRVSSYLKRAGWVRVDTTRDGVREYRYRLQ